MKNRILQIGFLILSFIIMTSCVPKKKILYMQDIDTSLTESQLNYKSLIKKDDILRITVTSKDMALVAPFNQLINATNKNDLNAVGQGQLF
ncbi:MAG: polysaccharide export protein, partial [Nonlabens sp.]